MDDVIFNESFEHIKSRNIKANFHFSFVIVNKFYQNADKIFKIESHSTIIIVYDLKTLHTNRAVTYCLSLYRLSKLTNKYDRHLKMNHTKNGINTQLFFMELTLLLKC